MPVENMPVTLKNDRVRRALRYAVDLASEKALEIKARLREIDEDGEAPGITELDADDAAEFELDARLIQALLDGWR